MDLLNELRNIKKTINKVSDIRKDNVNELEAINLVDDVLSQVEKKSVVENRSSFFPKPRVEPEKLSSFKSGLVFY